MENVQLAIQVAEKIISGMFLTQESLIVLGVFALGGLAFWLKAKTENI